MEEIEVETLGERIRELRKQRGMTLEELAGSELTKGMLSLIENNRAKPSMESLRYIAKSLGVEASELLEEVSTKELRELLEKAEKFYTEAGGEITFKESEYKKVIELIRPYIHKLSQGYESARLLELYGRCLAHTKQEGWEPYLEKAADIYDGMNLTSRRAGIGFFRATRKFITHQYQESLSILQKERSDVEANHVYIDPLTRLEFGYYEAAFLFAVGDLNRAVMAVDEAIEYSRKEKIFYLIDELYRIALGYATVYQDREKIDYYSNKIQQYIAFADDEISKLFYEIMKAEWLMTMEKDYTGVLNICNRYVSDTKYPEDIKSYLYILKGGAHYYLNQYEESLQWLEKAVISPYIHHPFDLAFLYMKDLFKALVFWRLGHNEKARCFITLAWKNMRNLPNMPYQDFVKNTYNMIVG